MFVLPSVVCSTLVAREIADATGAVTVSHQHGCGHIGRDVQLTRRLYVGLAKHANVARTLVVGLGCETVQGRLIAAQVERLGWPASFVGIQEAGGAAAAVVAGIAVAEELIADAAKSERVAVEPEDLVLGIAVSRADERVRALVDLAIDAGARVLLAEAPEVDSMQGAARVEAAEVRVGERPTAPVSRVSEAGAGAQLLAAATACGAQVLVEFQCSDQPPQGFAIAPILSVAAPDGLHAVIDSDFDLGADTDVGAIWRRTLEVFSGAEAEAELRGSATFAIPRLLRTM